MSKTPRLSFLCFIFTSNADKAIRRFYPGFCALQPINLKILLVEDEVKVSALIKKGLEEYGHVVVQAYDGEAGMKMYSEDTYDLLILDVIMPHISGLELCRRIKALHDDYPPILFLTALGTTQDVVDGLEAGGDDYLTKPFRFKELLARLNALKRRSRLSMNGDRILKAENLQLHTGTKEVRRSGQLISLTAREFSLLEFLLRNKNRIVSKSDILEKVWEGNSALSLNVVEVYINYLRNKIDRDHSPRLIKTLIGMGYGIKDEADEDPA